MPTPPRFYSPSTAEKLRIALLALAATATTGCSPSEPPVPIRTPGESLPPPPKGKVESAQLAPSPSKCPDTEPIVVEGEIPVIPVDTPPSAPGSASKPLQLMEEDIRKMEAAFGVSDTTNAPVPEQMVIGGDIPAMPLDDGNTTTNVSSKR